MTSLKTMSVADLRRELERREKGGAKLLAAHAKLAKRLAAIDAELADLGVEVAPRRKPGPKPGRKPGRPAKTGDGRSRRVKNSMTLLEAILKGVPTGKTVSPAKAAAAAKAAGYKSAGQNFGQQVATCLASSKKAFKKLGRGQYRRVGGGGAPKAAKAPKAKSGRKPGRAKGSKNKAKVKPTATLAAKAEAAATA